jgi:DNA-binding NtrC family response regulator
VKRDSVARPEGLNMPPKTKILVVDDDRAFRVATRTLLEDTGYEVTCASSGREGLSLLEKASCDLLLTDLVMEEMTGLVLLGQVHARYPGLPVIMVTGFGSIQTAVEAMRLGAADYVTKPHNSEELLIKIRRALAAVAKDREIASLQEALATTYSYGQIISRSERMKSVLTQIRQVADTDVTILLQGESGTGKELVAKALHFNSNRRSRPFVATNCSALSESLLESELFGYVKGAFTGALGSRTGRFEEAHTGTLFLDEIGDISPTVQKKLLRVLQEKTVERVGGNSSIPVDVRVIAATNRNLEIMVQEGDFREDLYYRLNVFPISLPPLRERLEDVPLLVHHFLRKHADLGGGRPKEISQSVLTAMMNYRWRGNIRELENLVRRAIITSVGEMITSIDLPSEGGEGVSRPGPVMEPDLSAPYREYLGAITRHAEEQYLLRMLKAHRGNINQIARLMEVDRKTVYRKLAEYAIDPAKFRE